MRNEQQVEAALRSYEDVDSWKTVIFLYNAALKEVGTKLEILNDEFQHVHQYNPIEHIKTRIKTPESIVKKLESGEVPLDDAINEFNTAMKLAKSCDEKLKSAEEAITKIVNPDGSLSDFKVEE